MASNKSLLNNVVIIRLILVVLLVYYHAFAPYSGGWNPIEGFPDIPVYWWLDKLSYAFLLESFVFVSGYVFGFQVRTKGYEKLDFKPLLWGKFKRLIVPSICFSVFYVLLFKDFKSQSLSYLLLDIFSGVGHLWFLPMLFWCFLFIWVIERLKLNSATVLSALLLLSIIPQVPLQFQLSHTLYYMFFFYVGYRSQKNSICLKKLNSIKTMSLLIILFIILFPLLTVIQTNVDYIVCGSKEVVSKIIKSTIINSTKVLYSSLGILMMLSIVDMVEKRVNTIPSWLIRVGSLCMAVYLIQQFVLVALYYYTSLPLYMGAYLLPWAGFIITLSISLLLSILIKRYSIGRILIGN